MEVLLSFSFERFDSDVPFTTDVCDAGWCNDNGAIKPPSAIELVQQQQQGWDRETMRQPSWFIAYRRTAIMAMAVWAATTTEAFQPVSSRSSDTCRLSTTTLYTKSHTAKALAQCTVAAIVAFTATSPGWADEIGIEKEAPTLSTGETVEICTKRGPLGACLKTEFRTETNDNDKAKQYFRDPTASLKAKREFLANQDQENEGNALIQSLKQRSEENKEKNDLYVQRKTFEADQSATFGPFDRQVLIMNTDGKTFTLLQNPVAMKLKKAGFIDGKRQFITQPTEDDLAKAEEQDPGLLESIFGGSS